MKPFLFFLFFAILCTHYTWAQTQPQGQIKGHLTDQATQQPLADATVSLLRAKDSSMAQTTFTGKDGAFSLQNIPLGDYRLYISFIGYQAILHPLSLTVANSRISLDSLRMQKTGVTLSSVEIIREKPPIVVKTDTLEFNASAYKTRENSAVEELLKKLPGVQIEKDGTIKAQGETIKKILVDGKPFFGDDPKLTSKNLPADIVEKIQLIDKKSDQAAFTRIDDGQKEKAINIIIKEDKKKGYFGRASAGYGTDDRFAVNASINSFTNKRQLSFIGGGNNVNSMGFGGGDDMRGSMRGMSGGGNGITRNWNGGLNYSQEIGKKLKISGSYFLSDANSLNETTSARQNFVQDTTYLYDQKNRSVNDNTNHQGNFRLEYEIDSMHSVVVMPSFGYSINNSLDENTYATRDTKGKQINNGVTRNTSTSTTPNLSTNILFRKRFKKAGRTVSVNVNYGYNNNKRENFNRSETLLDNNGAPRRDTLNQRNDIEGSNSNLSVRLTYTEPVFKSRFLELTYAYNNNYNSSDKFTYNYNATKGDYDQIIDSLSNVFKNTFSSHQAGISLRTQRAKYDYTFGINVQVSALDNDNISRKSKLQQTTTNFFPSASFNYTFSRSKRLRINYRGSTQQPSLAQLQPVPDNSNPLYIQLGNPDLKPSFSNNLNLSYNSFNAASLRGFFANVSANITSNKVVNANTIDKEGKQTSKPVNVNGSWNINGLVVNTFPLKKLKTSINTNTSINYNRDVGFSNTRENITNNLNITQGVSFNYMQSEILDFSTAVNGNYNATRNSVQLNSNTNIFNYDLSVDFNLKLPLGLLIGSDFTYTVNTGRADGYNLNVSMLNAYFAKTMFKNKQGMIKLQGFDLLKQNVSISRNVNENYIEDVQSRVLQRYFMLSFTYFLNKFNGAGMPMGNRRRMPGH